MLHLRSVALAVALLALAIPLVAQTSIALPDTAAVALTAPAPSVPFVISIDRAPAANAAPAWATAHPDTSASSARSAAVRAVESGPTRDNGAMMVVGGAALLVGAIVGGKSGTALMVGGGVLGLFGLWNTLK